MSGVDVSFDKGLKGTLVRGWITEINRFKIDPQIKNAHSGYRDQGSGLWISKTKFPSLG